MASFIPDVSRLTLEEQIKSLADDELLDFWEESQYIERFLEEESVEVQVSPEYERLILQELMLRSCRRVRN